MTELCASYLQHILISPCVCVCMNCIWENYCTVIIFNKHWHLSDSKWHRRRRKHTHISSFRLLLNEYIVPFFVVAYWIVAIIMLHHFVLFFFLKLNLSNAIVIMGVYAYMYFREAHTKKSTYILYVCKKVVYSLTESIANKLVSVCACLSLWNDANLNMHYKFSSHANSIHSFRRKRKLRRRRKEDEKNISYFIYIYFSLC